MGLRRDAREAAIQFLYQVDTYKPAKIDEALAEHAEWSGDARGRAAAAEAALLDRARPLSG